MRLIIVAAVIAAGLVALILIIPCGLENSKPVQSLDQLTDITRPAKWSVESRSGEGLHARVEFDQRIEFDRQPVRDEQGRFAGFRLTAEVNSATPDGIFILRLKYVGEDGTHRLVDEASEQNGRIATDACRGIVSGFVPVAARGWYLECGTDKHPEPVPYYKAGDIDVL